MGNLKKQIQKEIDARNGNLTNNWIHGYVDGLRFILKKIEDNNCEFWKTCIIETIRKNPGSYTIEGIISNADNFLKAYKERFEND